jgi:hypothetical protein
MKGSHIFSQILQRIDWDEFNKIVKLHKGDKGAKGITCRSQFVMMVFAHIAGADSLNEICNSMSMQGGNLNHMGIERIAKKSSLSYANEHRSWMIYRDMFEFLVKSLQSSTGKESKPKGYKGKLFSVDSTTIDLCLSMFPWARFHHKKGAVKMHALLDHDGLLPVFATVTEGRTHDSKAFWAMVVDHPELFPEDCWVAMDRAYVDYLLFNTMTERNIWFVTRLKINAVYETKRKRKVPENSAIISDEEIQLTSAKGELCEYLLRKVIVWDKANNREIILLCNNMNFGATTIAAMYKQRWQIELFFKQIKQSVKIRSFVGTSENAVKTQIYCALCAIVLLNHLKGVSDSSKEERKDQNFSFSNMVVMLRISLFRYVALDEWLRNPFNPSTGNGDYSRQHSSRGGGL